MGTVTDAKLIWGFDVDYESRESEVLEPYGEEKYDELEQLEEKFGCELVRHCSNRYTSYILGIASTLVVAHRGYPKAINEHLYVPEDAQSRLDEFAKALGIGRQKGKWLLLAYYG